MQLTYDMVRAASQDAGNRSMTAAGRAGWNEDDWNAACQEFDRLVPHADKYKVIVPYHPLPKGTISRNKGRIRYMSYPCSGCPLYTYDQARALLTTFHERHPLPDGDQMEPWAEGDHERFTYHWIEEESHA